MNEDEKTELTPAMKELLVRVYRAGDKAAYVVGDHDRGRYVRVGEEDLDDDPARRRSYLDALDGLVGRGFMAQETRIRYVLTSPKGFDEARLLAASETDWLPGPARE